MKTIFLQDGISAKQLINLGITVEFDKSNSKMKLTVSDNKLSKYGSLIYDFAYLPEDLASQCELIIYLDCPIEDFNSPINCFEVSNTSSRVFQYLRFDILPQLGTNLKSFEEYRNAIHFCLTEALLLNFIPFKQDLFFKAYKICIENGGNEIFKKYLFCENDNERMNLSYQLSNILGNENFD